MPHVREVGATPHDDHDAMLVAALAAGDLAGTERDAAIALIGACAECASLHDDLQAIARATAKLPPPLPMPDRDFRISAQQAGRLRRGGWRRLLPTALGQATFTRPLGVGLATFGLIGLVVTNVSIGLSMGSAASAPEAYSTGGGGAAAAPADQNAAGSAAPDIMSGEGSAAGSVAPAASAMATPSAAPSMVSIIPKSTAATGGAGGGSEAAGSPQRSAAASSSDGRLSVAGGSGPAATAVVPPAGQEGHVVPSSGGPSVSTIRNIVFAGAILIGLALLILARQARRLS